MEQTDKQTDRQTSQLRENHYIASQHPICFRCSGHWNILIKFQSFTKLGTFEILDVGKTFHRPYTLTQGIKSNTLAPIIKLNGDPWIFYDVLRRLQWRLHYFLCTFSVLSWYFCILLKPNILFWFCIFLLFVYMVAAFYILIHTIATCCRTLPHPLVLTL